MLRLNLFPLLLESLFDLLELFLRFSLDLILEHLMRLELLRTQLIQVFFTLSLDPSQIVFMRLLHDL